MTVFNALAEVISTRSFSNIWYWIALAAVWTTATQYVLGVPVELIGRAQRQGGQAMADLEDICRVQVTRLCRLGPVSAALSVGLTCAVLTVLGLTGFLYGAEFAQALFFLVAPLSLVGLLQVTTAQRMYATNPGGLELCRQLQRLRLILQAISVLAILVTAFWGMWRNLFVSPFGG